MGRIAGVTPEETRERLLDAAARVFELKGYEGATVAQIAKAAGVSSGAIYAHYSTKAELLVDALRAHKERATAALFPPGRRTSVAALLAALGAAPRHPRPRGNRVARRGPARVARRDAELAQVLATALGDREQLMVTLISRGQMAGELTVDVSPESAARFALMLGLGSMLVRTLGLPDTDAADWKAFIHRLVAAFTEETDQ